MLIRSFRKYLAGRSRFVRPPSQSLSTDMQCILLLPTIILSIECFTFPSGSTSTKILVPAYGYPTGKSPEECVHQDYLRLAGAGAKVAAIVNPSNGPVSPDTTSSQYSLSYTNCQVCFQTLFTAGNEVFGYVKIKIASETSPVVWLQTGLRDITEIQINIQI